MAANPGDAPHDDARPPRTPVRSVQTNVAQGRFLGEFAEMGNITQACARSNVGRRTHYDWLQTDPDYPALFQDAQDQYMEALEGEATRRAKIGWEEPVFQGGREVGQVRKFSDALLMFLMKGGNPAKYRDGVKPGADETPQDTVGLSERQRQVMMDALDELEKAEKE